MKDTQKTKEQLIGELAQARQGIAELAELLTDEKAAEQAIREAREYAESIVATVREPLLVLDANLGIVSANRSFYLTFGVKPEETQGRFIYDLGNQQWDIPRLRELLEKILPRNTSFYDFEVEHNFPAIGHRVMVLNASRLYSETKKTRLILLAIQDVTEHKRAEEKLSVSETRYRRLFETAQDGILILNGDTGQITDVNPFLIDMLGYSKEELLGKRLWEIGPFKDVEASQEAFQELQSKGYVRYEHLPLETKNGHQISVEFVSNVYPINGDRVIQCNIRDITKRVRAEEELRDHRDQLEKIVEQRTAELEDANTKLQEDITRRKQVEEALKASMEALAASEKRYGTIFESAAEGILIADIETRQLKYANPAICRMLGYSQEELVEMAVGDIYPKDSLKYVISEFEAQAKSGKTLSEGLPCLRKDGTILYADIKTAQALLDGKKCNIGFFTNVTERMLAEEGRRQNTEKLLKAMGDTIKAMVMTVKIKDPYTSDHQQRVSRLATCIAHEMELSAEQIEAIRTAGLVHDIGKMYVPSEILSKPGRLNESEFDIIRMHAQAGYDILKIVEFPWPIAQIVLQHHERMDGSGYPGHLSDKDIILEARVLAVADVVEAMASHRPYRPALGIDKAVEEISQKRGVLYDSEVVDACLKLFSEKGFKFDGEIQAAIGSPLKIG
jgi:PAS domain S-box-containing protein/putative nucleotidyltransferase with HDIG domain